MGGELLPPGGHKSWEGASVVVSGERKETIKGSPEYHRPIIDQTSFCCECWPLPGTTGNPSQPDLCDTTRGSKSPENTHFTQISTHTLMELPWRSRGRSHSFSFWLVPQTKYCNGVDLEEERNKLREQLAELSQRVESLDHDNVSSLAAK